MFSVARFALQAARFVEGLEAIERLGKAPSSLSYTAEDALRWATMEGARMLRLDHRIGSLTPGKQADIVLLATDAIRPIHDPIASIVLHAGPRDVDGVLIAGKFRKRNRRLLTADAEKIQTGLEDSGRRILSEFKAGSSP
jgi:cytosine/adenosine deaminase-related metal-dependent hydrolase